MEVNNNIYRSLAKLSSQELSKFGFISCKRVVKIYKAFDSKIKEEELIPIGNLKGGYDQLNSILLEIESSKSKLSNYDLEEYVELSSKLSPNDDEYSILEAYLSQYVANCISYYLKFLISDDRKNIGWCSDSIIEIVNFIESEKLERENLDSEDIVNQKILEEIEIQSRLIELIEKNVDIEILINFAADNEIKWS